jgi:hypothetical protein
MAGASFDFQMANRQIGDRRPAAGRGSLTSYVLTLTCEAHSQFCVASLLLVSRCGTC